MKFREIFRFEFAYQLRRVQTWIFFGVLAVIAFVAVEANFLLEARNGDYLLNSPYVIAYATLIGSLFWLLVAAPVAGEAAARDIQTRIYPLTYTAPIRKADYLGGRFLAAFVLNALILFAVPVGILLGVYTYGMEAGLLGPFRPAAYLTAYGLIALPNAFIVTAIQFSLAALSGRAMASYLSSVLLVVSAFFIAGPSLPMLDPTGVATIGEYLQEWPPLEKNTRLIGLEGPLLANRLLWFGIALGTLAFTHHRFRFAHPTASAWWGRRTQRRDALAPTPEGRARVRATPLAIPQVRRGFGFPTHMRQALAIAWTSFWGIAKSGGGLFLLALAALLAFLSVGESLELLGAPLLPRTDLILHSLALPEIPPARIIIPLIIIFWSGELVWREREARLSEIVDAAPLPEWVLFLGKFLGLGLVLVVCMAIWMMVGLLVQASMGYDKFEIELYLQILFGLQLADYLLLALLALVVHVVVDQKYVGHLVILIAAVLIALAATSGFGHPLLFYGVGPAWSYTDMRGFGPSLGPWLWFKLYWTAWALLLAVVARLLWVRGREGGLGVRLGIARRRFTNRTAAVAATAVALVLTLGGFIFYNTNVLNEHMTLFDILAGRAEYERRYGQYAGLPQLRLTGVNLHVEIYPDQRKAEIRGTYQLVNRSGVAVDAIHLATAPDVETSAVAFDRPAAPRLADEDFGHHIYALVTPLQPGDSLQLDFEVRFAPRGFRNETVLSAASSVVANGTFFTNEDWLPAIGYQANRELTDAGMRRAHGLAPRPLFQSLDDIETHQDSLGEEAIAFEAVVGTIEDQIAVAPGALRRTWTEGGRRYFHYATAAPIWNQYAFLSAAYAVLEGEWQNPAAGSGQPVAIRIFHHPGHTRNLDRMLRSVQASLDYYTRQFGPYPHRHITLVERPGIGGMHAYASLITFQEGFSLFDSEGYASGPDLPFSVVAHEVAHQWWGSYLAPRRVEGNPLLAESLTQYAAYQVVAHTYGQAHLRRLILTERREETETPRTRADVPLLRATSDFHEYSKGPWALYALGEYIGAERVNEALRRLLAHRTSGVLVTSLDLYRELQAVTPDSLQYLLHDLFAANTFWELQTVGATAEETDAGAWQVTLDVRARKLVVDEAGVETEVPMDDWVEVGVFAPAEAGEETGEPLYVQKHRIHSGEQTITMIVPQEPARAGIDPFHLLMDWELDDNVEEVKTES
jgi:ABC-2 type transport system permease protein